MSRMKRSMWFVIVIASGTAMGACGDDGGVGHLPDARPPPDTGGGELPPPRVTVSVTLGSMPVMGQIVYFQNHDSTLVSEAQTNSGGNAAGVVDEGGFVTVIEPTPLFAEVEVTTRLATFTGVKPLDELHLDITPLGSLGAPVTFNVSVPNEQVGNTYTLYSTCGTADLGRGNSPAVAGAVVAAPLTASVTLLGCSGTADLLVLSTDVDGQLTGWQYQPDVTLAAGADVGFTGAYLPPVDTTFTYTNLAASSTGLTVERELRTARGSLYRSGQVTASPSGTMATVTIPMPAPAGAQAVTTTADQPATGNGRQTIVEWGAADASYLVDYAGVALHDYATRPAFEPADHAIQWTEAAGGAPDFVLGTYRANRDDNVPHDWIWRIVAPYTPGQPGSHEVRYPRLPTGFYDFNPKAGDSSSLDRLVTMKVPGGYDAARGLALDGNIPTSITGATGRIVYEEVFSPPVGVPTVGPPPGAPGAPRAKIGRTLPRGRFTPHAR
jgi:hypothetical protein